MTKTGLKKIIQKYVYNIYIPTFISCTKTLGVSYIIILMYYFNNEHKYEFWT